MNTLEFARMNQRLCADRYIEDGHPGAELGMGDWFAEEFLMLKHHRRPRRLKAAAVRTGKGEKRHYEYT